MSVGEPLLYRVRGLDLSGAKCVTCGAPLDGCTAFGYPHRKGVDVGGLKLWLYVCCKACGYQNSFQKLGLKPGGCRVEGVAGAGQVIPWEKQI